MKPHLLLIAGLCALIAASGCSSAAQQEAHWSAQARRDMRSGHYDAAIIELRNAVRIAPKSADLRVRLARACDDLPAAEAQVDAHRPPPRPRPTRRHVP